MSSDSIAAAAASTTCSLPDLLSSCADACHRGCLVIRAVHAKRLGSGTNGGASSDGLGNDENGDARDEEKVRYKIADDPRSALTEADGAAQKVILLCLREAWGDSLNIIGEEDEDDDDNDCGGDDVDDVADNGGVDVFAKYGVPSPREDPLRLDLLLPPVDIAEKNDSSPRMPLSELTVYVDPMDGTREFVERRVHNVRCLVGVVRNGTPVGGVIGVPLVRDGGVEVVYGTVPTASAASGGRGAFGRIAMGDAGRTLALNGDVNDNGGGDTDAENSAYGDDDVLVLSGDSEKRSLTVALDRLQSVLDASDRNLRRVVAGGCGNKMLRVAELSRRSSDGAASAAFMAVLPPGTSSWDTASPTAVLLGADLNSSVTDLYGDPLVYDGMHLSNDRGVVASNGRAKAFHDALCEALREDDEMAGLLPPRRPGKADE